MTTLIASGMCCCFSCCCQQCSEGARRLLGNEKTTKLFYFTLVVVFVVPAIFVFFFLNQWSAFINYFQAWFRCPQSSGQEAYACVGASAIFRLSLCLLILFALMFLFMLLRARLSMIINEGCFCFKYMLVVGLFIGSLWISNDVFMSFSDAAQYISIFYMIIQSIILIDLFYLAGIKLVKHYDAGETRYGGYLIGLTIIFYGVALTLNILGYVFFSSTTQYCPNSSLWVNIITSIILVILPVVQLLHFNPQNSLLTTSLVSLFISYLALMAQFSFEAGDPLLGCNRMTIEPFIADIVCSTFFFIMTMYGTIMGGTGEVKMAPNNVSLNEALGVGGDRDGAGENKEEFMAAGKSEEDQNEQKYTQSFDWAKWHFYMCLASIYVSMLITNWGSADLTSSTQQQLQPSSTGFWVRVAISWATSLLYTWTMVAPRIFPSRDFTVE